jgi:fermentation-respiration switch protein FrsA (DUF1100 family)
MPRLISRPLNPFAWLERKALFTPERSFRGNPEHVGLDYTDIFPATSDGVKLHGWHMPAGSPSAHVWLILHGNGGNISVRLDQYKAIRDRYGVSIVAIDYRGYGKSEGKPSEYGLYSDALAAYQLTQKLHPNSKIIVFGRSLGGAVASQLASVVTPPALILEASISSMKEIVRERAPWTHYSPARFMVRSKFETASHVSNSSVPKLIIHGDSDQTVSFQHSERIFAAASEPKQLEIIPSGDHDGLDLVDPERYHSVVSEFLRDHGVL